MEPVELLSKLTAVSLDKCTPADVELKKRSPSFCAYMQLETVKFTGIFYTSHNREEDREVNDTTWGESTYSF